MEGRKESNISILAASRSSCNRGNLTTGLEEIVHVYVFAAVKRWVKRGSDILLIQNFSYIFLTFWSLAVSVLQDLSNVNIQWSLYFLQLAQNQLFMFVSTSTLVLGMLLGMHIVTAPVDLVISASLVS